MDKLQTAITFMENNFLNTLQISSYCMMVICFFCKIYFHYQFKKSAFTHKNFIDKMRPFSPDFKLLIWIFFPYWVIDRNSNNQNRIYSNICTSLFYGLMLFIVISTNNTNNDDPGSPIKGEISKAYLLGGWQYYEDDLYFEIFFDSDTCYLFTPTLFQLLDINYSFDSTGQFLQIKKNGITFLEGEIFGFDKHQFILKNPSKKSSIPFKRLLPERELGDSLILYEFFTDSLLHHRYLLFLKEHLFGQSTSSKSSLDNYQLFKKHFYDKPINFLFQDSLRKDYSTLLNSADFVNCQKEEIAKLEFSICTNRQGLIKMIDVRDPYFSPPEELKIGMKYKSLSKSHQNNLQLEPGFGRWIELASGWQAHLSVKDFDDLYSGLSESQIIEFQLK